MQIKCGLNLYAWEDGRVDQIIALQFHLITISSIIGDCIANSPSCVSMHRNSSSGDLEEKQHRNTNFMRKIPPGAEASNILVGEVEFLEKTLAAFVRLNNASILGDLTEVPIPTR